MTPRLLVALVAGSLFGAGLAVSGMMNPAKVLNFLDVAGRWDPSLALVMAAALAVTAPAFRLARRRQRPAFGERFEIPTSRKLDASLLVGAALFGLGWGLVGLCPGPAVAVLVTGLPSAAVFLASMVAGMAVHRVLAARR
jgi:uncharacterized membrane protein YedE/YeeE